MTKRECGSCSLCCRLLPVRELDKGANQRCVHQRHTGCTIHGTPDMPRSCRLWACRWLTGDDTADLPRPDRGHFVVDVMLDYITVTNNDTGDKVTHGVIQVWLDPKHSGAHRNPQLRAYLARRAAEGFAALIRHSHRDALILLAPAFTGGRGWQEITSAITGAEHTAADIAATLGPDYIVANLGEST